MKAVKVSFAVLVAVLMAMGVATNSLNFLFSNKSTLLRTVRDIGLDDRVPAAAYRPTYVRSMVMVPIGASTTWRCSPTRRWTACGIRSWRTSWPISRSITPRKYTCGCSRRETNMRDCSGERRRGYRRSWAPAEEDSAAPRR